MNEQLPSEKKLTKAQRRMRDAVARFQRYVATYSEQPYYTDCSDKTFIDDMLYGIGLSMAVDTAKDNSGPSGYERFKRELREHLK